jgi:hypothetical protein
VAERVPKLFLKALADLTEWLEGTRAPTMVVGGVAASILGRPRATRDIDALTMLPEDQWAAALAAAPDHGIVPRIEEPLEFARRTRVLLLRHVESAVDIDVILGRLPFEEEALGRSELHDLGGVQVRLPQVEDLLIMKVIAQRPRDLRDIEGLLDVHPGANLERVRQSVREFATAMVMPDLLEGFEKLLAQRKPKPKR